MHEWGEDDMEPREGARILETLLDGIDPETGEILPEDHLCARAAVLRALHRAICALQSADAAGDAAPSAAAQAASAHMTSAPDAAQTARLMMPDAADEPAPPRNKNGRLNAGRPWTCEDDAVLLRLFSGGSTVEDIAAQTERRVRGVRKRLLELGAADAETLGPLPTRERSSLPGYENAGRSWTAEEEAALWEMNDRGLDAADMARTLHRGDAGVLYHLAEMGLVDPGQLPGRATGAFRPWLRKDTARLRELVAQGLNEAQIAQEMRRPVKMVRGRLFYLGLSGDAPSLLSPGED